MSLTFVIIGCGNIGKRHAEYILAVGRLIAVCDIDHEKANDTGRKYNADIYYSIEELFSSAVKADVAVICTPNGLHALHSITALQHGFHVLCEKPMAIKSADCIEMISTAERAGKQLVIVKQNRFNPPVIALKKTIDENRLGKIFSVQLNCFWNRDENYYKNSWKGTKQMDGGILFTQFSHFIDLLYWLFGDVKQTKGIRKNFTHSNCMEFEDTGMSVFEFDNGIIGAINYTINSFKKNMEGSLTVFGEKGTIKVGGQYLNELEYQFIEDYTLEVLPSSNRVNDYGFYEGSMSNHDKVYSNLVDVLMHQAPAMASCYDGFKTVEMVEKIYNSSVFII